jgi:hypothetical protein
VTTRGSSAVERALLALLAAGSLVACTVDPTGLPQTGTSAAAPDAGTSGPSAVAASPSGSRPGSSPTAVAAPAGSALAALRRLPVKGRAPMTGYSRAQFGRAWEDVDHNGCDTRNDILRRDLRQVVLKPGTHGCVVLRGVLVDPYTGATVDFVRGVATSRLVQIDHVVALGDAWQKGAQPLSPARRTAFANDPLNLLAVTGKVNDDKGDGDAATWLPPRRSFRCSYVARQVAVKTAYHLWVTAAERDAMARVLATCPRQALPTR